ncbi:DUF3572 domain-containing protein [Marivivens marinus]|uniref:DUF3572 domain-containing protein n=1 Tax=Marivivens marinus TaxID=3110173 RepID=UPI003B84ACC9
MNPERAETIAIQALGWLATNDDLFPVFLGSTGASADDLRAQAADPGFLGSVLDFLTMDDAWVVAFCDAAGLPYDTPLRARHVIAGEAGMHWT